MKHLALVSALLTILAACGPASSPAVETKEVTRLVEKPITVLATQLVRQEPLPTYTPYPVPSAYPTYTPYPVPSPYPTYTPHPTYTPYPMYTQVTTPTETVQPAEADCDLAFMQQLFAVTTQYADTLKRMQALGTDNTYALIQASTELEMAASKFASLDMPEEVRECGLILAGAISAQGNLYFQIAAEGLSKSAVTEQNRITEQLEDSNECFLPWIEQCQRQVSK